MKTPNFKAEREAWSKSINDAEEDYPRALWANKTSVCTSWAVSATSKVEENFSFEEKKKSTPRSMAPGWNFC